MSSDSGVMQEPETGQPSTPSVPPAPSDPPSGSERKAAWRDIGKDVLFATAILVLMTFVNGWMTSLPEVQLVKRGTYDWLQWTRTSSAETPAVALDLQTQEILQAFGGGRPKFTSRRDLERILTALSELPTPPRAVAVAVDFSPVDGEYVSPYDPRFFAFCQGLRQKGMPVYLGIDRTVEQPSDTWLGAPKYKDLAVSMRLRTRDAGGGDDAPGGGVQGAEVRRTWLWTSTKSDEDCPTLAAAVAGIFPPRDPAAGTDARDRFRRPAPELPGPLQPFLQRYSGETVGKAELSSFQVDYGSLAKLQAVSKNASTLDPDTIREHARLYAGKLVVIGDATSEQLPIPGRTMTSGLMIHAAAAATLAKAPLDTLSSLGSTAVDLFLFALAIIPMSLLRLWAVGRPGLLGHEDRVGKLLSWTAVLIVYVAGSGWFARSGVMWDDYWIVIGAMFFEPLLSGPLHTGGSRLWQKAAAALPARPSALDCERQESLPTLEALGVAGQNPDRQGAAPAPPAPEALLVGATTHSAELSPHGCEALRSAVESRVVVSTRSELGHEPFETVPLSQPNGRPRIVAAEVVPEDA